MQETAAGPPQCMDTRPVLNVDDHSPARFLRTRILQRAGFGVDEADCAAAAIELAPEASLLLLDVKLPDGDGFTVCEADKRARLLSDLLRASEGLLIDRMSTLQPRDRRPIRVHLDVTAMPRDAGERVQLRWILSPESR